ncbi:hypothetical protein EAG_11526 [Camponotus floridanus]|uniref:Uncharacterized protein n=1 Tax=Camponotus floridanus TaxID=104421 RepID=E2AAZ5_CAMFO|nr:hypothetical protein EAG_11526 [Camponotus floridanus]
MTHVHCIERLVDGSHLIIKWKVRDFTRLDCSIILGKQQTHDNIIYKGINEAVGIVNEEMAKCSCPCKAIALIQPFSHPLDCPLIR